MKTILLLIAIAGILSLSGCIKQTEPQTGKFIDNSEAEGNITCIGRLAGASMISGSNRIIIGDFTAEEESKTAYIDYMILIKWDWGFFNTPNGKILKEILQKHTADMPKDLTKKKERFEFIRKHISEYWSKDISAWYEKQRGINP